jgi:membrane protease YdiL (CAAX protease family)
VLLGMNDDLGVIGKVAFGLCKAWILLFPVVWHVLADGRRLTWPKWSWRGVPTGAALGAAIAAVILGAFFLLGDTLIDPGVVRDMADTTGLSSPWLFAAFFAYMVLINSLLEEYVWRWFVYAKCRDVTGAWGGRLAILISALLFTVHHTVALAAQTTFLATLLGSVGVFIGGAVWSWSFRRFGTLWPAWVSHILADVAIVVIAWRLILV